MVRPTLALCLLTAFAARDPGCGGVDSTLGGPNAPCTRDKDCAAGLTCPHGFCVGPDSGSPSDGGEDSGTGPADADNGG